MAYGDSIYGGGIYGGGGATTYLGASSLTATVSRNTVGRVKGYANVSLVLNVSLSTVGRTPGVFLPLSTADPRYPQVFLEWAPSTAPTAASQGWEEITDRMRRFEWSWGRNDELGDFAPGRGSVLLDNRDRAFDPAYTDGPWFGNVKPRRAFRLTAKEGTSEYVLFVGYARGLPQEWPAYGYDSVVRVELDSYMAVLATFELPVGFSRPGEKTGSRIAAVLDAIGFPAGSSHRAIDPGTVTVAAITVDQGGVNALQHIKDCATAEFGQFFDRNGMMVFHDRTVRIGRDQTFSSVYTFADARGVGEDARFDDDTKLEFDDAYLVNQMRVDGPDPQTHAAGQADSASSKVDYWTRSKTLPTLLDDVHDRFTLAEYYVLRYAQPEYRLPGLSFQMGAQASQQHRKNLLAVTVGDPVTLTRYAAADDPLSSDPIVLDQVVEGVSHTYDPGGPWEVGLATSPADTRTYWQLEDPVFGEIDNANILISP